MAVAGAQNEPGPKDTALLPRPAPRPPSSLTPEGRIHLDVLVTDAAGKRVAGLTAQDFTLLDDSHPRKIVSFHASDEAIARPDPPVEIILLVDTVNNGFTELGYIRQGLETYLRQNGGHLALPVTIMRFTVDGLKPLSPPSTDGIKLAGMVHQIKPSIRSQGIYPFPLSILALAHIAQEEARKPGRKLLIWLGPGWLTPEPDPRKPVFTPADERDQRHNFDLIVLLSTKLREARVVLYGGFANSAFYRRDFLKGAKKATNADGRMLGLSVLALQSGGRGDMTFFNRDSDLADQLAGFAGEANTFYTLSFDPPRTGRIDEYHDLKVQIDKPGLTARTNTGYYNQPEYSLPAEVEPDSVRHQATPDLDANQLPAFVAKPVTVEQLEQALKQIQGGTDGEAARQLSSFELTERFSSARLKSWKAALPGAKSWAALVALADASAFLALPAEQIPAAPAPSLTEQRRIVSRAVNYLAKTIPQLPNFMATRMTIRYEDNPDRPRRAELAVVGGQPWRVAGDSSAMVLYRDGHEVVDPEAPTGKTPNAEERGLITRGTFGPILSTVIVDAAHSQMTWSHWEQGATGPLAVFQFVVSREKSHYEVAYRSPAGDDQSYDLHHTTGYHGEVAFDAATGTILRLAVQADLDPGLPILRADIMVEYGAVDIGGKIYTCPLRSVSLSRQRIVLVAQSRYGNTPGLGPEVTRLSDVTFGEYHVFRGEARVLTGYDPAPKEKE